MSKNLSFPAILNYFYLYSGFSSVAEYITYTTDGSLTFKIHSFSPPVFSLVSLSDTQIWVVDAQIGASQLYGFPRGYDIDHFSKAISA